MSQATWMITLALLGFVCEALGLLTVWLDVRDSGQRIHDFHHRPAAGQAVLRAEGGMQGRGKVIPREPLTLEERIIRVERDLEATADSFWNALDDSTEKLRSEFEEKLQLHGRGVAREQATLDEFLTAVLTTRARFGVLLFAAGLAFSTAANLVGA